MDPRQADSWVPTSSSHLVSTAPTSSPAWEAPCVPLADQGLGSYLVFENKVKEATGRSQPLPSPPVTAIPVPAVTPLHQGHHLQNQTLLHPL